ncbi:MAG: ATP-binding protein [Candidatus Pseudobacter hemicellulosilyticus]|uniref:histidine kinase n=1 Tax=Candidatus Pseudobacter hemicellulosilyticus TaxID=3121375 RepID=A0AAJ6BF59_9BACT|nr:MAG: ATP-binding protein [Pseudobacter sp.]
MDTLQYALRHYTDENGLPQNSIKGLVLNKSGFLWMATENGVVRFDGRQFRTYDKTNLGLSSSRIVWLQPDIAHGGYFAETDKGELISINRSEASLLPPGFLPPETAININKTYRGNYPEFITLGLPNIFSRVLRFDSYKIPAGPDTYFSLRRDTVAWFTNNQEMVRTILPNASPYDFFLVKGQLYHLSNYVLRHFRDGAMLPESLSGDILLHPNYRKQPLSLYWDYAGGQAFVYLDRKLYLLEPTASGGLHTRLLLADFDLETNRIICIVYDERSQRLFLGSHTRGLFVLTRKQFITLRSTQSDADEVYYAQAPYGDNQVLTPTGDVLGVRSSGLSIPAIRNRVQDDRYSLLADQQGMIWVKQRQQLYRFDGTGHQLLRQYTLPADISQLYEGSPGEILIGTQRQSLYRLNYSDERARPEAIVGGLTGISYLAGHTKDSLWIGTSRGLYRWREKGRLDTIFPLEGKHIRSIHPISPDEIWISTYGDGFFLYRAGRLIGFPQDEDGYLGYTHCMVLDQQGYFWITTNKGLFQVSRQDLLAFAGGYPRNPYYHYYDKQAGFNSNEFNGGCQPCGLLLKNGYLSLPSMNGLVWGRPEQLKAELPVNELFLDKVEVDGRVLAGSDSFFLDDQFDFLKLYVTTPYFGNDYNIHLDFALVRKQDTPNWNPIGPDRTITLTGLSSGSYRLLVRKVNGFGPGNHMVKSFSFIVPPAYYESWWFRLGCLLMVVAIIWGYTRLRLTYVQRKNKLLEVKIDERTQTLLNTLTDLQLSEEILRRQTHIQDRLITAITHDIKSPLKYMSMAARRMAEQADLQMNTGEVQKNARMLYEAAYRMYHLTDNLLQYIKLNSRDTHINFETVDVCELVEDKVEIFRDIAAEQGAMLYNDIMPGLLLHSNNRLLGVVIHNLIDNAVKVTYNGQVAVSAIIQEEKVSIRVEDSGVGMNRELVAWCNLDPLEMDHEAGDQFPGSTGFGLIIVKELAALMNGRLRVTSDGSGSLVELQFDKEMLVSV